MGAFRDLTGQRFGRLTVLRRAEDKVFPSGKTGIVWDCLCDCGKTKTIDGHALKNGATRSCGCLKDEVASKSLNKFPVKHGGTKTRLYGVWMAMRRRCYNKNSDPYKYYGGRGITVCDEWLHSFEAFRDWAYANGYDENAPKGQCTLDRIDVNGNYCPENCRIVSQKIQANNTRVNHIVEYKGETMTIAQLSDKVGIPYHRLQPRIVRGMSAEQAVATPFQGERK